MIKIKTDEEMKVMAEGGKKLARVKKALAQAIRIGGNAAQIEDFAVGLIKREGAEISFNKVPGYHWATCITVNSGLVHGIPTKSLIFKKGDVVSVDVGVFYKGFHTDTSITVGLEVEPNILKFLNIGKAALADAISKVHEGNYLLEISRAIEKKVESGGFTTIKALVGHGVGRDLHEDPQIPCFIPRVSDGSLMRVEDSPKIQKGMVLAVEVMYTMGGDAVEVLPDGWTIATQDGKISALFEDTVAVTAGGSKVLTS